MIIPETLHSGDNVAIISSARAIDRKEVATAKLLFESWGLNVTLGRTIGAKDNQFAGNDCLRAEDLQAMIDDDSIKAVFFARGGYGSVRILDKINWNRLRTNPKWLIGYSDVTAILMHTYYNVGISCIHGTMPINMQTLSECTATKSLKNLLFSKKNFLQCKSHPLNKQGVAEGIMIGGNLSVIYSLLGSNSFKDTDNLVLFIEDLDEYLYHIDRMLQALKRSGKLKNLKALLVGQMSDMHDNIVPFGKTAFEIIEESVKNYDFPYAFNLPIGHTGNDNHAFFHGKTTKIIISDNSTVLEQ
ncbi:MAG: LD-carboxypeptidase [Bacteroidales bacterium]|nr:LD-carboxypeptidase [Bacteroidales bacterium]